MASRRSWFVCAALSAALSMSLMFGGCGKTDVDATVGVNAGGTVSKTLYAPEETALPLSSYAYDEVGGGYEGEIMPGEYVLNGDWDAYLVALGQDKAAFGTAIAGVFREYEGVACGVTAFITGDTLKLYSDSDVFFGSAGLELPGLTFEGGKAVGQCERDGYKTEGTVDYDLTLLAADGGGYRLVGTATVNEWADFPTESETFRLGYTCTFSFDMTVTAE